MKNLEKTIKRYFFLVITGTCFHCAVVMSCKRKSEETVDEVQEEPVGEIDRDPKGFNNLAEADAFITEYINDSISFNGIIKQRYSDFQVNEIDINGKLIELTDMQIDPNLRVTPGKAVAQPDEESVELNLDDIDENEIPVKELTFPITTDDQWKQFSLLFKRNKKNETIRIEITNVDKEGRKQLHQDISKRYKSKLRTTTVIDDQKRRFMEIGTGLKFDKRENNKWPRDGNQYLYAVLFKENSDTISVVQTITKKLKLHHKSVTYAGTKDRRGVTSQLICLTRIEAPVLAKMNYKNKVCFGNYEYRKEILKLGDLQGNKFRLAIRNVETPNEDIENTMSSFKNNGFINYFGLQRFGSYSGAPTYEIGRCLINKQWKEAINLILKTRPKDNEVNVACKIWTETANASDALKSLRRRHDHSIEEVVLRTLAEQGNTAYVNALQKLPRNVVSLYLHSFQSLVWNRIVSRRIKEFGLDPIPGDLILTKEYDVRNENLQEEKRQSDWVRAITADEIKDIKKGDIVYPLPGYAMKYPDNVIAEWYQEILKEYNVKFDKADNKGFNVSGDFRKMITVPSDVQWKITYYNDSSADLILTDYQKLYHRGYIENFDDGQYKAVILEFNLPSCCYATMALREITKSDTSAGYQASLTHSHLNKVAKLEPEPAEPPEPAELPEPAEPKE